MLAPPPATSDQLVAVALQHFDLAERDAERLVYRASVLIF
jgi:hypothetical protein